MAMNLKLTTGTIGNYNNITTKENGTIYFATDEDGRAYIYFNDKNIVPKMADLRNGGLGADYSNSVNYPAYSILMLGSDGKTTTTRAPAAGAFYTDAASNKPKFGTLPVAQGGLGLTSITKGAILYGNTSSTTGAVSALSPGTNGYVLVSTGSAPKYVQPTMSWTNGSAAGPIFNFTFNGTSIAGAAIPAATDSISGIITTGTQTMTGVKTWMSTTYASSIHPRTTNTYNLGYWNSASDNKIWNGVAASRFAWYDEDKINIGYTTYVKGGIDTQGYSYLVLGNKQTLETANNSRGILQLYGPGSGRSQFMYVESSTDTTQVIPAVDGHVTISQQADFEPSTSFYGQLPFYISTSHALMKVGHNDGYWIECKSGDTSTVAGHAILILGNSIKVGTQNNKAGALRLMGDQDGGTTIYPNKSNGSNWPKVYLPAATGELVYHTEDTAQGGSGQLISVNANGQIVADTTTDIASDVKLMYLKDGLLTASTANVANDKKHLMYLDNGTLTVSDANIASDIELMYLVNGELTKSGASIANNKKLMYLSSGKLTASDADVGGNTKPIYLEDGELKPASSTIASSTQLMYMNSGALTPSTADVGGTTQPVYLLDGVITLADAYSTLLTAFSSSDNTMSITVGGTPKDATIINTVSNSWSNGTTAGPTLSTTVNGKAGTAVAIPSASYTYSGIITTGNQTIKGIKTFASGIKIAGSDSTTDCATFTYDVSTDTLTIDFPS